uniref:DUF8040 domain-containing protein n=1 Tax=Aegilops tauschii TaxID=37682 RepID=N1R3T7_AEGTA
MANRTGLAHAATLLSLLLLMCFAIHVHCRIMEDKTRNFHLIVKGQLFVKRKDTFHVTLEEQVAMFIHVVGHNWKNISIGFEFYRPGETDSRYFNAVLDALCLLSRGVICIRTIETHSKITSSSRFHPYFEAAAISKSGNVFDDIRCVVTISESEKSCLNDRARRLLSKPIKFYYEM